MTLRRRAQGGLFAALTLPLASTIAVNMVPDVKRPAAIATVLVGYTLAFLIGVPMGTFLGDAFGWRAAFWFSAVVSALAVLVIMVAAPKGVSAPELAGSTFKDALRGDNVLLMVITFLGFSATFVTVSYIGPVITAFSGLTGAGIGDIQIAVGVGSLLGLPAVSLSEFSPITVTRTMPAVGGADEYREMESGWPHALLGLNIHLLDDLDSVK